MPKKAVSNVKKPKKLTPKLAQANKKKTATKSKPSPKPAKKSAPPRALSKASKKSPISTRKPAISAKKTVKKRVKVAPIPKGYRADNPYLIVSDAMKAIEFYKNVFGAKMLMLSNKPNGKVAHAELKIGDTRIMIADEAEELGMKSPAAFGGSPVSFNLYVKDVDATIKLAESRRAKLLKPIEDMFYGDRAGLILDPFGHVWHVATHIENVSPAALKKRVAEIYGQKS